MRVLVLDGNENQAVASVRALARAGHRVAVGADTSWSKAGWSRACAERFQYPEPDRDADSFVASIAAQAAREAGTLVLPMTERTTLPLSSSRDRIAAAGGRLVLPPHATLVRAFDKKQMTELAQTLGLEVPATVMVSSDADALECSRTLRYPVVLKPGAPWNRWPAACGPPAGRSTRGTPANSCADGAISRSRCRSALAQEFIDGVGMGYFALMRHGDLLAEFAHIRLRDVRPTGSGSSLRVSVTPDRRLRSAALAMLDGARVARRGDGGIPRAPRWHAGLHGSQRPLLELAGSGRLLGRRFSGAHRPPGRNRRSSRFELVSNGRALPVAARRYQASRRGVARRSRRLSGEFSRTGCRRWLMCCCQFAGPTTTTSRGAIRCRRWATGCTSCSIRSHARPGRTIRPPEVWHAAGRSAHP